eukprot:scaffold31392_cov46-Prasinocladus_malaysianus.AAC.1
MRVLPCSPQELADFVKEMERMVQEQIQGILGHAIGLNDNLFESGMDSIEVMELRSGLTEMSGVELEVQVLYDNPTISHLASHIATSSIGNAKAQLQEFNVEQPESLPEAMLDHPGSPAVPVLINQIVYTQTTPLFLLQPMGVPGSRAYYNFVRSHLGWVDPNPIYVLDHVSQEAREITAKAEDPFDLVISSLARQVSEAQHTGPYVLGGHSLGGLTSLQVAISQSEYGEKAEVFMFDSAHPTQMTPHSNEPINEQDIINAIENGLGTMGSELLGLGPRNVAVRDTASWRSMSTQEKLDFWRERISRVAPGADAIEYAEQFARAIKNGFVEPSDKDTEIRPVQQLRGKLGAESYLTYARPLCTGSLSFFDDSKGDHGVVFVNEARTVEVIDVPGNHYTLLHQEDEDMAILVQHMQKCLSSSGIGEMAKVSWMEQNNDFWVSEAVAERQQLEEFLRLTGV